MFINYQSSFFVDFLLQRDCLQPKILSHKLTDPISFLPMLHPQVLLQVWPQYKLLRLLWHQWSLHPVLYLSLQCLPLVS